MSEISITICLLGFMIAIVGMVAIVSVTAYSRDKVKYGVQGNVEVGEAKIGLGVDFESDLHSKQAGEKPSEAETEKSV